MAEATTSYSEEVDDDPLPGPVPLPPQWGLPVAALVCILLALVIMRAQGVGYDFRVKVRGREVSVKGKRISAALRSDLQQFFGNDFPPKQRLTVYARRRRNRTYELRFLGRVTAGEKQQVRNFLMSRV